MSLISETRQELLNERIRAQRPQSGRPAILARARQIAGIQRNIKQIIARSQARTVGPTRPAVPVPVPPVKAKRPGTLQPLKLPERVIKPVGQQVFLPDPIDAIIAPRSTPVSIWADLGKSITKGISTGIAAKIAPQPKIAPAMVAGAAGRVLPAIGRVLTGRVATGAGIGALAATIFMDEAGRCPVGFHPKKDGSGECVRNRRMNFGNARAARRSVRRLKGARKLLTDIERMMPRRKAATPRRPHHHHPAAGG